MKSGLLVSVFLAAGLLLGACGDELTTNGADGGRARGDGGASGGAWLLFPVGNPVLNTKPGRELPLTVMLVEKDVGPVSNEYVSFVLDAGAGDAKLTADKARTDEQGFATLNLLTGSETGTFQVEASAGKAPSVIFTIRVEPQIRKLVVIGDAERNTFVQRRETLRVKLLDSADGRPIAGEKITYALLGFATPDTAPETGAKLVPAQAVTAADGQAQSVFHTGNDPYNYSIKVSADQAPALEIKVHVGARAAAADGCLVDSDCGAGLVCEDGACIEQAALPGCRTDENCSAGYQCNPENSTCEPIPQSTPSDPIANGCVYDVDCPDGFFCNSGECRVIPADDPLDVSCQQDTDCPIGFICDDNGKCNYPGSQPDAGQPDGSVDGGEPPDGSVEDQGQPDIGPSDGGQPDIGPTDGGADGGLPTDGGKPPCMLDKDCPSGKVCEAGACLDVPPPEVIDVSGLWFTQHKFDMSNALLGFPKLGGPLNDINRLLQGKLDLSKIPLIGNMLQGIINSYINQYVPPWVKTLVGGLDNLANVLQEMDVEGEMELRHGNPKHLISGKEEWIEVIVYWVEQCPMGRKDPNWPSCAAMNIVLKDEMIGIKEVGGLTGRVSGQTLIIDDREVEMEIHKLIKYIIDLIVQISAGYNNLEEAIQDWIDCQDIEDAVNDLASDLGFGGTIPVKAACEAAKAGVAADIGKLLSSIGISWTTFKFHGHATIVPDTTVSPPYGIELKDGIWDGRVKIIIDGKLKGTWHANR
ncbi:MAG: hypothetical protein ABIH03_08985 [Pseudomonadota bacterium]